MKVNEKILGANSRQNFQQFCGLGSLLTREIAEMLQDEPVDFTTDLANVAENA